MRAVSAFRGQAIIIGCLCASYGIPLAAQTHDSSSGGQHDRAAQGGGRVPAGWSARLDENGAQDKIRFVTTDSGFHVTLGPAGIFYRTEDLAKGPFHTLATFREVKRPEYREGYGLFFGGERLTGSDQHYTYFLVRGDGKYLIKRRDGGQTSDITQGWTASSAIKKGDAKEGATNLLEIDAKRDPTTVTFKVNGTAVHTMPAKDLRLAGIVGLRVNHNLDLQIQGFAVHQ
jgi:hypothetical protein